MSIRATTLKRSYLVAFFVSFLSVHALAQAPAPSIAFAATDPIVTSFIVAPSLGGGTSTSSSSDSKWLKIEFHYSVTPPVGDFLDAVEFRVWVEGRDLLDPQGQPDVGIAVGLTGNVTYVNVPGGKDAYGVFYVHPNTLTRYSTKGGPTDFDRKFDVHVEAYVGGLLVSAADKNKETDPNWFNTLKPITGLVFRQNQCPFIVIDPDRYPAIKLVQASQ